MTHTDPWQPKPQCRVMVQAVMVWLFHCATCGYFHRQVRPRTSSLTDNPTSFLLHDTDARRKSTSNCVSPCILHMGDYLMTINSVSEQLPSSVYQAFPPHLVARAFYVQRTLLGLGAIRSPSFLCHPLVTAESIRTCSASLLFTAVMFNARLHPHPLLL